MPRKCPYPFPAIVLPAALILSAPISPVRAVGEYAEALEFAESQVQTMITELGYGGVGVNPPWEASPKVFPKVTTNSSNDVEWEYTTVDGNWGAGYMPGILWALHDLTADPYWEEKASAWTDGVLKLKTAGGDMQMNLGFHTMYSVARRQAENPNVTDSETLSAAAQRLTEAWMPAVGSLYSFTWGRTPRFDGLQGGWSAYANTIVDSTPNLEILFHEAKRSSDAEMWSMAMSHLGNIIRDNVREDGSTAQLASYDKTTGELLGLCGWQGYSGESTWSRGQGWALHGMATAWRETGDPVVGEVFHRLYTYYRTNAPEDGVPYWDFNAPDLTDEELEFRYPGKEAPSIRFARDSSAAALAAAALLEASRLAETPELRAEYLDYGRHILTTLSTPGFLAMDEFGQPTKKSILGQGSYTFPGVGKGQVWGDFYYMQALLRAQQLSAPETVFAADPQSGDLTAYETAEPQLWTVEFDDGGPALRVQGLGPSGQGQPTAIALHSTPLEGDFAFRFRFRADENLALDRPVDAVIIYAYEDPENYSFARFGSRGGSSLYSVENGIVQHLASSSEIWNGQGYHEAMLIRRGAELSILVDGRKLLSNLDNIHTGAGKIGFASLGRSIFFDEPSIITGLSRHGFWALSHFPDPQADEADDFADPDADGLPNLLEYAVDTDPLHADDLAEIFVSEVVGNGGLRLTYPANGANTDIEYRVVSSFDGGATWNVVHIFTEPEISPETVQLWNEIHSGEATSALLRLEVRRLAP